MRLVGGARPGSDGGGPGDADAGPWSQFGPALGRKDCMFDSEKRDHGFGPYIGTRIG